MRKFVILCLLLFYGVQFNAQSKQSKWAFGVNASVVYFGNDQSKVVKEQYNYQFPKLNITRYLFEGFSLEAGITVPFLIDIDGFFENSFDYWSIDGALRYDFNLSDENLVPYLAVGGSYIKAPSTIPNSKNSPTLNFSLGGTFWFHHHWGIHSQFTYKFSPEDVASMASHSQLSAGIVYSFKPRQLLFRVWD